VFHDLDRIPTPVGNFHNRPESELCMVARRADPKECAELDKEGVGGG
jgi:hypothetical protein